MTLQDAWKKKMIYIMTNCSAALSIRCQIQLLLGLAQIERIKELIIKNV